MHIWETILACISNGYVHTYISKPKNSGYFVKTLKFRLFGGHVNFPPNCVMSATYPKLIPEQTKKGDYLINGGIPQSN